MSNTYTIEADGLFRPQEALKQELQPITPIAAANAKKAELWSDGSKFYFRAISSSGSPRKYPRIQFYSERPKELAYCSGKETFSVDGLICDYVVTEVVHDGSYFYVWNLEIAELDEVLYGKQSAA